MWHGGANKHYVYLVNYSMASGLSLVPLLTDGNSLSINSVLYTLKPTTFNKPFDNGRYLCNVAGCPSTFSRKANQDRHIQSWHYCATLHFCPVPRCKKSLGKPYSRKDKL